MTIPHVIKITRKELFKEVWTTSITQLSKKFGLSDVGLAKTCRRNNIPTPPKGYWAKIYAGKKIKRPRLPQNHKNNTIRITPSKNDIETFDPDLAEKLSAISEESIKIKESLRSCHPLVKDSNRILMGASPNHKNILVPETDSPLNLEISKKSLRRALLIMDAIIRYFEKIEYPTKIEDGKTLIFIDETSISIKMTELFKPVQIQSKDKFNYNGNRYLKKGIWYESVPSGKLCLTIDECCWLWERTCQQNWRDTDKSTIENRLISFIQGMIKTAYKKTEYQKKEAEKERIREEKERIRHQKIEKYKEEQRNLDLLYQQTVDYYKSKRLRELIAEVKNRKENNLPIIFIDNDLQNWIDWAEQQADRIDPFCPSPVSILDENIEDF